MRSPGAPLRAAPASCRAGRRCARRRGSASRSRCPRSPRRPACRPRASSRSRCARRASAYACGVTPSGLHEHASQMRRRDVAGARERVERRCGARRRRPRRRWRASRLATAAAIGSAGELAVTRRAPRRVGVGCAVLREVYARGGGAFYPKTTRRTAATSARHSLARCWHGDARGRDSATRRPRGGEPVVRSNHIAALVLTVFRSRGGQHRLGRRRCEAFRSFATFDQRNSTSLSGSDGRGLREGCGALSSCTGITRGGVEADGAQAIWRRTRLRTSLNRRGMPVR